MSMSIYICMNTLHIFVKALIAAYLPELLVLLEENPSVYIYIYIYMYICMYVYTHIYLFKYIYVSVYICLFIYIYISSIIRRKSIG
jgi:hypothetical protein